MPIAIYRKGANSYLLNDILFPSENTEELFREVRRKRDVHLINVDYREGSKSPAFIIAGLSEDLNVLDAALILSGLPRIERKVKMLIVNLSEYDGFIYPSILESDVINAKIAQQEAKNAADLS